MFTPEELEAAANFDLSTLPKLEKTMAQYINEARDGRKGVMDYIFFYVSKFGLAAFAGGASAGLNCGKS